LLIVAFACKQKDVPPIGTIERIDPALDALIDPEAVVEKTCRWIPMERRAAVARR
jgi:hypothetical protein